MAFLITREQRAAGKLYLYQDADGELLWTPNKDKAKRFESDEADVVADQFNRYTEHKAEVVGAGRAG